MAAAGLTVGLGHDGPPMRPLPPGHFRTVEAFRARLAELALDFSVDDAPQEDGPLAQPTEAFGRRLDNRFAALPMEGWDGTAAGAPSEHTLRRWRRFGQSGAALVFGGEAFAVRQDGKANPRQLCLHADSERDLAALLQEVRRGRTEMGLAPDGALIGLQLTHSGRFARPHGPLAPKLVQRHPLLEAKYGTPALPLLTDGELEAIAAAYVPAAQAAQRAGFAFVDIKCCHGYLLHEALAGKTRPGSYGGSLANRMRLFERIVRAVQAACPGLGLAVRLSAADTEPYEKDPQTGVGRPMMQAGCDPEQHHWNRLADPRSLEPRLDETIAFLRRAGELGVALVNVTLGSPYWNPHLQRPAAYPPSDGYLPPGDPLAMVALHLRVTRRIKQELPGLLLSGTGYTYLQEWLPHAAQHAVGRGHVDMVGLGRMLLSYPQLPLDVLAGRPLQHKQLCRTFSDCTTAPRNGMVSGCFPLDPYYKAMPEAQRLKELKKGAKP